MSAGPHDGRVERLWRILTYLCVAQLYLEDNVTLSHPLRREHVKENPQGHWGVCPNVTWVLANVTPFLCYLNAEADFEVLHGAGHAGPAAFAYDWLRRESQSPASNTEDSLGELARSFPDPERGGGEITPLISGVKYMGGQLGPTLGVAQGMALDAPTRLVIPIIGDGECESGVTSAAWLAPHTLSNTGDHGAVLPILLLNRFRMGGLSQLGRLTRQEVIDYFIGLGYQPIFDEGMNVDRTRIVIAEALAGVRRLGDRGLYPIVICGMLKGWTGPVNVGEQQILGTRMMHKTPLEDPRRNSVDFQALESWLDSYRPSELFETDSSPADDILNLMRGLIVDVSASPRSSLRIASREPDRRQVSNVADAIRVRVGSETGRLRVFSPDEAASNRLGLESTPEGDVLLETLNEELCYAWLQGYTEYGGHGLLASYEAFAPMFGSQLVQHLKQRALQRLVGVQGLPSINVLLTSLCWENSFTHQNPSLSASVLDLNSDSLRVYTPADRWRAGQQLYEMLATQDLCNVLIASKSIDVLYPRETYSAEREWGAAVWPQLSHGGKLDLVVAAAGDVATREAVEAVEALQRENSELGVRFVAVHDLAGIRTLEDGGRMSDDQFCEVFGPPGTPLLFATVTPASPVRSALAGRGRFARTQVVGYKHSCRVLNKEEVLNNSGISFPQLRALAYNLMGCTFV